MQRPLQRKLIIASIITIVLVIASFFIFQNKAQSQNVDSSTISTSVTVTPTPTDLPSETITLTPTSSPSPTATTAIITTIKANNIDKMIYYPVDKQTALDSNFVPNNLVSLSASGIAASSGSYRMRKEVIADMLNMFTDAKKAGINLRVSSPYRSYSDQQATFNYWVSTEKAKGLSQADAEAAANTYSAYPGHSEHQLGTTADINDAGWNGSDPLDTSSSANQRDWAWLKQNMSNYGFVLSYPEGKDKITGYIFEPWHIRWVGHDVAAAIVKTDYLNPNNTNTSTTYLRSVYAGLNK